MPLRTSLLLSSGSTCLTFCSPSGIALLKRNWVAEARSDATSVKNMTMYTFNMATRSGSRRTPKSDTLLPMALSLATILLAILAIAVFIAYGGSIAFYIVCFIAIIVAIYNVMTISKFKNRR